MRRPVFPPMHMAEARNFVQEQKKIGAQQEAVKYLREVEQQYDFLQEVVVEMGKKGFFDYCQAYEGLEMPLNSDGNPNYERAEAIFVQSAERADALVNFIVDTYLGKEQKYSLSEFVKVKDPIELVRNLKGNPESFQVRRKLFLTLLFAIVNQYFAKEQSKSSEFSFEPRAGLPFQDQVLQKLPEVRTNPFEHYSIVHDRLEQSLAEILTQKAPELFVLSPDTKTPISEETSIRIFLDPVIGNRVRIIEIKDQESKVLHYSALEDGFLDDEQEINTCEDILANKESFFARTISLKIRYLKGKEQAIPVILLTRAKPFDSFILKMLRREIKDPSLIRDAKGLRFCFFNREDMEDGLAVIQKFFPVLADYRDTFSLEEINQDITIDGAEQGLASFASSPKFQCVNWASQDGVEIQGTLLPFYINENHTFAAESHDVYRALQYLEQLLPKLFPEEEYGENFSWQQELSGAADIIYSYFYKEYYTQYKETHRNDSLFKEMRDDQYDVAFPHAFYQLFLTTEFKRWLFDFKAEEGLLAPKTSDLSQIKEVLGPDKYQELIQNMEQVIKNSNLLANIMHPDALKLDDSNWFESKKEILFGKKLVNAIRHEILEIISDEVYKIKFGEGWER